MLFGRYNKLKWHKKNSKKKEVALLISARVEFKSEVRKENYFMSMKVTFYNDDIIELNIDMPNIKY